MYAEFDFHGFEPHFIEKRQKKNVGKIPPKSKKYDVNDAKRCTMHPNQISLKSNIFKIMSKHRKMTNLSPFGLKKKRIVLIFHAEFDFNGFEPYFIEKT